MPSSADAKIAGKEDGYLFSTAQASAKASYSSSTDTATHGNVAFDKSRPPITTQTEWLTAGAGASAGSYTGVNAGAHLVAAEDQHSRVKIGLGVDTGIGVQNTSAKVDVLGFGVSIGRETGVKVFDSEFTFKFW